MVGWKRVSGVVVSWSATVGLHWGMGRAVGCGTGIGIKVVVGSVGGPVGIWGEGTDNGFLKDSESPTCNATLA